MFQQLGVIGCGLMGGSFALALKRAGLVRRVVGYSKSPSTTEKAKKLGVSLRKTRGFWTPDPKEHPINFWLYEAQHDADRAPVKG